MRTRSPNLTWLRSFEAAARLLNFTEAGRELGLTQTAISLHIKSLEATLGCQLFIRRARHLSLNQMGQAYVHAVGESLGNIDLATTSLFGSVAQQMITVRAPISTAELWLASHLPQFSKANPGISIRLISTIWATSISDEGVDVDIRQGVGDWPDFEVEQISTESVVLIQSKAAKCLSIDDLTLQNQPVIHILGFQDMWDRYLLANHFKNVALKPALIVDTTVVAVSLVAAGGGLAVIQSRFANNAVAQGIGISIIGKPIPFPQSHYLVHGKTQRKQKPEVAIFKEWVRVIFSDQGPTVQG